jgi:hypothetical protein
MGLFNRKKKIIEIPLEYAENLPPSSKIVATMFTQINSMVYFLTMTLVDHGILTKEESNKIRKMACKVAESGLSPVEYWEKHKNNV